MMRPLLLSCSSRSRLFNGEVRSRGAHVDDWRYCPFHPEKTITDYCRPHDWRKPGPGMITDLMAQWPVDAARSFLIGDEQSGIEAAPRCRNSRFPVRGRLAG